MKVADVDAAFPDRTWTYARGYHAAKTLIPATLTHLARAALGLATETVPRETMLAALTECMFHRSAISIDLTPRWPGAMAMAAAYLGDWDVVATCTGKPLGEQVPAKKLFGTDAGALARHLASAARGKRPAILVAAAMHDLRERFWRDEIDGRVAVLAAALFVRDLVVAEDVVATTRAWLDGTELELPEPVTHARAIADGQDARVVIFERYQAELGADDEIDRRVAQVTATDDWSRDVEREREELDGLAILAFVARRPLFAGWPKLVDPAIAAWLGADPWHYTEERFADLRLLSHGGALKHERGWDQCVKALAMRKLDSVLHYTRTEAKTWKPGKFWKDDGRKLLGYIAAAIHNGASAADVEPAWLDFLARRSPATTPHIAAGAFTWKHLLLLQAAITCELGGRPRAEAGATLRATIAAAAR
jgi:hypothetical protein